MISGTKNKKRFFNAARPFFEFAVSEKSLKKMRADGRNRLPFLISFVDIYVPNLTDFSPRLSKVSKSGIYRYFYSRFPPENCLIAIRKVKALEHYDELARYAPKPEYYDGTYNYLKGLGLEEI